MKYPITALAGFALVLGLAGCGAEENSAPATSGEASPSHTQNTVTSTSSSAQTSVVISVLPSLSENAARSAVVAPTPPSIPAPTPPPFMTPEEFDPYGSPRFLRCWEAHAAVMSDGTIVADSANCAPQPEPTQQVFSEDPPRADGCVGPAATCGYYDDQGNPIWFDKTTGETSPRYYDENGNPTMQQP